jgi:hypothetical protein
MKANEYLYAAYIVTWVIHCGYILYLTGLAKRLREDMRELDRDNKPSGK